MIDHETETIEFELLREDIRGLIAHPIDHIDFFISDMVKGTIDQDFPDRVRYLPNVSIQRAQKLFEILREEVARAYQQGTRLGPLLQEVVVNQGRQDSIDHERTHIEKAVELGIDLGASRLKYLFTQTISSKLATQMTFFFPPNTDPFTKVLVALAPERLSHSDFMQINTSARQLSSLQLQELHIRYGQKMGFDIRKI